MNQTTATFATTFSITLNGEPRQVASRTTLADFIAATGQRPQALSTAVNGDFVAMEPTLSRAIDVAFGRAVPSGLDSTGASVASPSATPGAGVTPAAQATVGTAPATAPPAPSATAAPVSGDVASLVAQAAQSYTRAQDLLRAGDFAGYGAENERLKQILDRLQASLPVPTRSP